MPAVVLILVGIAAIVRGAYTLLKRYPSPNQPHAQTKPRQQTAKTISRWERHRRPINLAMIGIGVVLLGLGISSLTARQLPIGEYVCLPKGDAADVPNTLLTLESGGTGRYADLPLRWIYDDAHRTAVFDGANLVLGTFPVEGDDNSFMIQNAQGDYLLCLLR